MYGKRQEGKEMDELLSKKNQVAFTDELTFLLKGLINWKTDNARVHAGLQKDIYETSLLPQEGEKLESLIRQMLEKLPQNMNFSSTHYMGFPDSGNSLAGLTAGIIEVFFFFFFINSDACSPLASKIECDVLSWMRQLVGYNTDQVINDVCQLGGAVTTGGTMSNVYAVMAAAHKYPNKHIIILPDNIGHYSLSYAVKWLNLDVQIVYCKVQNFKLDLNDLEQLIKKYRQDIMLIGVYACDSMTSTCEDLKGVYQLVKRTKTDTWLHCDACHGFVLNFTSRYSYLLDYLKYYDSCTMDPQKVLWLPYTMSIILMKKPQDFAKLTRTNQLIIDDEKSFGKTTPFIGSKAFNSLKLWFVLKNMGKERLGKLIEKRIENAQLFLKLVQNDSKLLAKNQEILFSVTFQYTKNLNDLDEINTINRIIYKKMLKDGKYYLHGFDLKIADQTYFVLRYNSGNLNLTKETMVEVLQYVDKVGGDIYAGKCQY